MDNDVQSKGLKSQLDEAKKKGKVDDVIASYGTSSLAVFTTDILLEIINFCITRLSHWGMLQLVCKSWWMLLSDFKMAFLKFRLYNDRTLFWYSMSNGNIRYPRIDTAHRKIKIIFNKLVKTDMTRIEEENDKGIGRCNIFGYELGELEMTIVEETRPKDNFIRNCNLGEHHAIDKLNVSTKQVLPRYLRNEKFCKHSLILKDEAKTLFLLNIKVLLEPYGVSLFDLERLVSGFARKLCTYQDNYEDYDFDYPNWLRPIVDVDDPTPEYSDYFVDEFNMRCMLLEWDMKDLANDAIEFGTCLGVFRMYGILSKLDSRCKIELVMRKEKAGDKCMLLLRVPYQVPPPDLTEFVKNFLEKIKMNTETLNTTQWTYHTDVIKEKYIYPNSWIRDRSCYTLGPSNWGLLLSGYNVSYYVSYYDAVMEHTMKMWDLYVKMTGSSVTTGDIGRLNRANDLDTWIFNKTGNSDWIYEDYTRLVTLRLLYGKNAKKMQAEIEKRAIESRHQGQCYFIDRISGVSDSTEICECNFVKYSPDEQTERDLEYITSKGAENVIDCSKKVYERTIKQK